MAQKELERITSPSGNPVLAAAAERDGEGKDIKNTYAKQKGAYEGLMGGNLIPTVNHRLTERIVSEQVTCADYSTFDGTAVVLEARGYTTWANDVPKGASIFSITSIGKNLFNGSYALNASNDATEYRISGDEVSTATVVRINGTALTVTEKPCTYVGASAGATYFSFTVPAGHKGEQITVDSYSSIHNLMIMLVWSGYNTEMPYRPYENVTLTFDSSVSEKVMQYLNEEVYDYIDFTSKKLYTKLITFAFTGSQTFSAGTKSGSYYPYTISVSNSKKNGYAQIGAANPISFNKDLSVISGECFGFSANGTLQL